MSSYSEYLGRMQQRSQKIVDTRPHRDAGHQTEIIKRLAASGVQENKTPASSQNMMLNAPSTRVNSVYKKAHTVQDTSLFDSYTAGQAVAQGALPVNAKTSQIIQVCYSSTAMPEYNDRLRNDAQLSAIQDAKNAYGRGYSTCCRVCGEPPSLAGSCACALTVAQRNALKDNTAPIKHTVSPA
jgi:hypothetical protein